MTPATTVENLVVSAILTECTLVLKNAHGEVLCELDVIEANMQVDICIDAYKTDGGREFDINRAVDLDYAVRRLQAWIGDTYGASLSYSQSYDTLLAVWNAFSAYKKKQNDVPLSPTDTA